jgi:hypothetical protein
MANYFNTLPLRIQLEELGKCRFMDKSEFTNGCNYLKGKKIVIIGCGAQGLNQGLNMRDSGLMSPMPSGNRPLTRNAFPGKTQRPTASKPALMKSLSLPQT